MSEASPCLNCGACCSYFRVSFFWGECASSGGTVPDDLVVQINPTRVAMIGTDQKPARCCSLEGEVGKGTSCSIYELRSSPCREFDASWSQGEQNVDCDAARAAFGLLPLEAPPSNWRCPSALSTKRYARHAKIK
ncbi:YkgJ family cysteine cluster protein [Pseudomonas sp. GNP013]